MSKELSLNQEVPLENKQYRVVGIDHYQLNSFLGTKKEWKSYTLQDPEKNKTWIVDGLIPNKFTQWREIDKETFKKQAETKPPILESSGIAHIIFEGDQGYSSPNAEVILFQSSDTESHDFIGMERFLNQNGEIMEPTEPYYQSGKILKDFTI